MNSATTANDLELIRHKLTYAIRNCKDQLTTKWDLEGQLTTILNILDNAIARNTMNNTRQLVNLTQQLLETVKQTTEFKDDSNE